MQMALECTVEDVAVRQLTGWRKDRTGYSIWLDDSDRSDCRVCSGGAQEKNGGNRMREQLILNRRLVVRTKDEEEKCKKLAQEKEKVVQETEEKCEKLAQENGKLFLENEEKSVRIDELEQRNREEFEENKYWVPKEP